MPETVRDKMYLSILTYLHFQALRVLLFGTPYTSFNSDWRKQHINFFTNMSYALSFYKVIRSASDSGSAGGGGGWYWYTNIPEKTVPKIPKFPPIYPKLKGT